MRRNETAAVITAAVVSLILIAIIAVSLGSIFSSGGAASETRPLKAGGSGGFLSEMFQKIGMKNAPPPESVAVDYLKELDKGEAGEQLLISTDGTRLYIDRMPSSAEGQLLAGFLREVWSFQIDEAVIDGTSASVNVYITCADTSLFEEPLREQVSALLARKVESAAKSEDVYGEDQNFRTEVLEDAFWEALGIVSADAPQNYCVKLTSVLKLEFYQKQWHILNPAGQTDSLDGRVKELYDRAVQDQPYIAKRYTIEETATAGPVPDQTKFGTTQNPAEVSALLESFHAKRLIGGQKLCWAPDLPYVAGSSIRYYLDETLLVLEWQEEEAGMVGTFSEIFVADGSQIRRKLAGDAYEYEHFFYATDLARQSNAVLAVGGDLYHHGRNCGIVVYNREIYRFDPSTVDTCYIDVNGDMLFSYRNQFSTIEEAQRFVDENNILYSICFGPVMIDNGVDVTPDNYLFGEIWDTYARAALGMLGEHHYLTMNLNCGTGHLYNYANLRQAADAMVERGCIKAYTLDGGQTCCTVVNGELVSPVQFGYERYTSDIIYFATAVPDGSS